jgi:8-oxo-dGTP pyrophosphatase MutT (NUDIX family)
MHRRPLLALLDRHRSWDEGERAALERTVDFVSQNPECFSRSLAAGHVTGSAWILDRDQAHALLMHHRKLGRWLQPGGHADGDADVLAVARREAQEETGLAEIVTVDPAIFDVDVHRIPARAREPEHWHYDIRFLLGASREASLAASAEANGLAWVALDQIASLDTDASVLRMVAKTRGRFR